MTLFSDDLQAGFRQFPQASSLTLTAVVSLPARVLPSEALRDE